MIDWCAFVFACWLVMKCVLCLVKCQSVRLQVSGEFLCGMWNGCFGTSSLQYDVIACGMNRWMETPVAICTVLCSVNGDWAAG